MVIGLLTLAAIPTTIGVAEGVNSENKENDPETSSKTEAERMRKFNLECYCESKSWKAKEVHGGKVVLRNDKIYIEPQSSSKGHTFEGFYINFPDPDRPQSPPLGLVSSIASDPPTLNWIFVDENTREVKYGNRTQSRAHIVGSWGWDAGEEGGPGGLTLEGEEGAVAVETEDGWEVRWEDENGEISFTICVSVDIMSNINNDMPDRNAALKSLSVQLQCPERPSLMQTQNAQRFSIQQHICSSSGSSHHICKRDKGQGPTRH